MKGPAHCDTCGSPKPWLHPCKQNGKPLKEAYATLEHAHLFEGKPVTMVLCNGEFHREQGKLAHSEIEMLFLAGRRPERPLTEGEKVILQFLSQIHRDMTILNYPHGVRVTALSNPGIIDRLLIYMEQAWPQ